MPYLTEIDEVTGLLDSERIKDRGLELRPQYLEANPFPHIAIDDFLPTALLDRCLENFPIADAARHIFHSLNSRPFLQLLENITAIKGLIPDPYYLGDG